jgi:hypothetical protein
MGFGVLRVINDDVIEPKSGFGMHPHRDMEIITIVTNGAVTHTDSIGNTGTVPSGDVQVMSAGTGIVHSEQNLSEKEPLTLFQIWITPREKNVEPRYEQKSFHTQTKQSLELLVSPDGSDGSLWIHQDAYISRAVFEENKQFEYTVKKKGNGVYMFVIDGAVDVEGETLKTRDAIGISETEKIELSALSHTTTLFFEVPMD